MAKGIIVPAAADQPLEERTFTRLEDYQAAIDGLIEPVDIPALGVTIYVNEEGLLRHLPLNSRATFLWWYHVPESRQSAMLVGDAVIVGLPDRTGESTDVPRSLCDLLLTPDTFRVEVRMAGDPDRHGNRVRHEDYFEALVWAMLTLERLTGAEDVRVVPTREVDDKTDRADGAE